MTFALSSLARRAFCHATLLLSVLGVARPAVADDDPILPFLDDGTFLVARLDVDRVDPAEVERFINDAADVVVKRGGLPADRQVKIKQDSAAAIAKAKAWLTDMQAAGGKRVYGMFLNSEDLLRNSDDPYFIVPMADGGDAARVGELMKQGLGGRWEAETIGKSLVLGKQVHIDRVRTQSQSGGPGKSIEPADFAAALAGKRGDDAPLRIVALPGEATRAWIEHNLPALPPQIGGGDTTTISRGIRWASLTVTQKPKVSADLSIRCTDASNAKAVMELITVGLALAKEQVGHMPEGAEAARQLAALQPKLEDKTITMTVDPKILIFGLMPIRVEREIPQPPGAQPARPDDGGL